jgi:hypothetical protein
VHRVLEENARAWKFLAKDALKYDSDGNLLFVNLDMKNPRAKPDITHLTAHFSLATAYSRAGRKADADREFAIHKTMMEKRGRVDEQRQNSQGPGGCSASANRTRKPI